MSARIPPRISHRARVAAGVQLAVARTPACIRRGRTAARQRCSDVGVRRSRQPIRAPWPRYSGASYWHPASSATAATVVRDALTEVAPPMGQALGDVGTCGAAVYTTKG
jgi:hypothetical protein